MPIQRSSIFRDKADVKSPGASTDGYGNAQADPSADALVKAQVRIGLFQMSIRRDWIEDIGGGPINLLDWWVAVPRSVTIGKGYAFYVTTGLNPGVYRVKQYTSPPGRTGLTLCRCNKES